MVWFTGFVTKVDAIESVQKRFVLYALRRSVRRDNNYILPSYQSRCKILNLETLIRRRLNSSAFFVHDLLPGRIDSLQLLVKFYINHLDRELRWHEYLLIPQHRTFYGFAESILSADVLIRI